MFEKLADTKWGVLGIQYRAVPCDYVPENPAPAIANPFPGEEPPFGTTLRPLCILRPLYVGMVV